MSSQSSEQPSCPFVLTSFPSENVFEIQLNNPKQYNALTPDFWTDFPKLIQWINNNKTIYVLIISSSSKHFCSGINVTMLTQVTKIPKNKDSARIAIDIKQRIKTFQNVTNSVYNLSQPVIMSIDGVCIGAGVDLITAGDIRLCTQSAKFSVKEVDMAVVANVGTMSRMHKITQNESLLRKLLYTGEIFTSETASKLGLVSAVYKTRSELDNETLKLAKMIASKSQIAIRGIKELSNYAMDDSVNELNNYVSVWNGSMLQTTDVAESAMAFFQKRKPKYSKL